MTGPAPLPGADGAVILGDFAFNQWEIPEKIPFGGSQQLQVHRYLGGGRVVDANGADPMDLSWSGRFQGGDAYLRARRLDTMRALGQVLTLAWDEFRFSVVIREFRADFERFYQLPYSITCCVVQDETQPIYVVPPPTPVAALQTDMDTATGQGDDLGDLTVQDALAQVQSKLSDVSTLVGQASAVGIPVGPLAKALSFAQGGVNGVAQAADGQILTGAAGFAGVVGGLTGDENAKQMQTMIGFSQNAANSRLLQGTLGAMQVNTGLIQ